MQSSRNKRKKRRIYFKANKNIIDLEKKISNIPAPNENTTPLKQNPKLYDSGWLKVSEVAETAINTELEKIQMAFSVVSWNDVIISYSYDDYIGLYEYLYGGSGGG